MQLINIGTSPNAGDGDTLRVAFSKINANFTEFAGVASTNLRFIGNTISVTNSNGNIILSPNGTGKIVLTKSLTFADNTTQSTAYPGPELPTQTNNAGKFLITNGVTVSWVAIGGSTASSTAPTSPIAGQLWYDPISGRIYVFYNETWVDAAPQAVYQLPTASANTLGGVKVGNNLTIVNGVLSATVTSLGNLTIAGQTISGTVPNADIILAPNGTGYVSVPGIKIPVGNIISAQSNIVANIATLILASVVNHSSVSALVPPIYGITNGIPTPWTVYSFTTTPAPILQVGDIIGGPGIPVDSTVVFVGSNSYSTYVIVDTDFGTATPPAPGITVTTARTTVNAGLSVVTGANTDITLNAGTGGNIVPHNDILPYTTDTWRLGSPARRFKEIWLGAGTIYVLDETLGTDQAIGARDGNLYIDGGAGLTVGQFTFRDNQIKIADSTRDIILGTTTATGNFVINRPIQVNTTAGVATFTVDRTGRTNIRTPVIPAGDIGAFSIIGNAAGTYQPVVNAGGMLHITGNDGAVSRFTNDAFGAGSFPAYISRAGRGTAAVPSATLSGDILSRYSTIGYGTTGFPTGPAATNIEVYARENFTDTAQGTEYRFFTAPTSTLAKTLSLTVNDSGISFANSSTQNTAANIGITFKDSTRQTTAWTGSITAGQITGGVVTSIAAGNGLTQNTTQGAVTIDANGVQNVYGTASQVYVTDAGSKNLTLSLPQNIDTTANPTFNNLTVNNLVVNGTYTITSNATVTGKTITLASDATLASQINGGGVILGTGAFARSILYDLGNNRWNTDGAGLTTTEIYAADLNLSGDLFVSGGNAHLGGSYLGYDFPNASLQIDENLNSYVQLVQQNHNNGSAASTDFVATNNLGDDSSYFIDMGINSSTYNGSGAGWTVSGANDAYLYNVSGNLTIGTATATKVIKFHTGGTLANNVRATLSDTGLNVVGDVTAATLHGTLTGNVTGDVTGNLSGNVTGNVTGNVSGNAGTVTNGVYTNGSYTNPSWIADLAGSKITGQVASAIAADNATTVTNGVYTTGSYSNPNWITSLAYSKITGAPTALSAFSNDTNYITSAAITWNNVIGKPNTLVYTTDVGSITNTMLNGSIANNKLLNSSLTVNGITISLGGTGTIAAAAGTLTGTTLASNVTASSLTAVGTLTNLTVTNTITGNISGNAGTVTNGVYTTDTGSVTNTMLAGGIANNKLLNNSLVVNGTTISLGGSGTVTAAANTLTGTILSPTVVTSSLTTLGTLTNLTVTNAINGNITGNAATVTDGVYTTGSYANPAWITSLAGSKITGASMNIIAGTGMSGGGSLGLGGNVTLNNAGVLSVNGSTGAVTNIATLTGGYLTTSQIPPSLLGGVSYQGTWSASPSNGGTPTLTNGTGTTGYEYVVTTGGTVNFGAGNITFSAGDFVIYGNGIWSRIPSASGVSSFNTRTGAITLTTSDVTGVLTAGSITNTMLASSAVTIGTTGIALGGTSLTLAGLTSVAATTFTGSLTGSITGNAATVTNGVYTTGAYANPAWITELAWSKISGAPAVYSSVYLGTTNVLFNRASGALSLTGVSIDGNAGTATKLAATKNINGTAFDGSADITVTAVNPFALTIGTGLTGTSYNGSANVTVAVDTSSVMTLSGNQTVGGIKTFSSTISGSISGNAGTVTNGVYTTDTGSVTNTMLAGSIANNKLLNSSVTVTAGTGMSGGGAVSLDGTITLTNAGVTGAVAGTGIGVSAGTGAVTISNTGVTSINTTLTGAVTGIVTTSDTGTITGGMIANSTIVNTKLANSSITIGTTAISLGGSSTTLAGLTSVSSTTFSGNLTGNVTGNVSGTAATITGVYSGTLTSGQVTTALGYTPISSAVTSLTGTANQITVSASTGAVTLSLPSLVSMPGELRLAAGTASVPPLQFQVGSNLTTAVEGAAEYDGKTLFFTSNNTERGIVKNPQIFILNANRTLTNQAAVQSLLGKSVTISTGVRYYYRILYTVYLSNGTRTSSAPQFALGGNAVLAQNTYWVNPCGASSQTTPTQTYQMSNHITTGFATGVTIANSTSGTQYYSIIIDGNLDCTTGGTVIPYFGLSGSTPGSSAYIQAGATMEIYPIGVPGADTSVGTWA